MHRAIEIYSLWCFRLSLLILDLSNLTLLIMLESSLSQLSIGMAKYAFLSLLKYLRWTLLAGLGIPRLSFLLFATVLGLWTLFARSKFIGSLGSCFKEEFIFKALFSLFQTDRWLNFFIIRLTQIFLKIIDFFRRVSIHRAKHFNACDLICMTVL